MPEKLKSPTWNFEVGEFNCTGTRMPEKLKSPHFEHTFKLA